VTAAVGDVGEVQEDRGPPRGLTNEPAGLEQQCRAQAVREDVEDPPQGR
jgi:hypothetical protein